ncbi:hypothetical protein [Afipia carboxidovorans]|uniref:hypothetical protein n=1 Tax=Afipia carboxidovorans TaxID=40137 RepID=UPI0030D1C109
MRWSTILDKEIVPPDGSRPIRTLADARDYLLSLPKARHADEDVQAAVEALLMAANGTGPTLHATAGIGTVVHGGATTRIPTFSRKPGESRTTLRGCSDDS